jgi:GNAT superfamily N-acetyltransferase
MPNDPEADLHVVTVTGEALRRALPALGRLRALVFRDWPYLYEAPPDYEVDYRGPYATSAQSGLVLARVGEEVVGAASCLPLHDETSGVQAPFLARGLDPHRFFYFGESVLLPAWRGRGIGVEFFRQREAHARAVSDADYACFCAVQRPEDHPSRPPAAPSLAPFWRKRGYTPAPDLVCTMRWRDVGDATETPKSLGVWLKSLRGAALP